MRRRTISLVSRDTLPQRGIGIIEDRNLSLVKTSRGYKEGGLIRHGGTEVNGDGLGMLNLQTPDHQYISSQVTEMHKLFQFCKFLCQLRRGSSKEGSGRSRRKWAAATKAGIASINNLRFDDSIRGVQVPTEDQNSDEELWVC